MNIKYANNPMYNFLSDLPVNHGFYNSILQPLGYSCKLNVMTVGLTYISVRRPTKHTCNHEYSNYIEGNFNWLNRNLIIWLVYRLVKSDTQGYKHLEK